MGVLSNQLKFIMSVEHKEDILKKNGVQITMKGLWVWKDMKVKNKNKKKINFFFIFWGNYPFKSKLI